MSAETAERVLAEHGILGAAVRAAGPQGEIAVVSVAAGEWAKLLEAESAEIVARVKSEGFRYVALDLDPGVAGG